MRLVALLSLVAACDPEVAPALPSPDPDAVCIGLLGPLSGPTAFLGFDFEKAARLAIAEINAAGGVNGKRLDLVLRDSRTAELDGPVTSIASTRALAAAGCVAVVGPDASAVVLRVTGTLIAEGLPLVSPTATAAAISALADDGLVFRTAASDVLQARVLARLIREDGVGRIAVIHRADTYGEGLAGALAAEFVGLGGEVVSRVSYPENQSSSFEPLVAEVYADPPEAIVLVGFVLDSAAVLAAIQQRPEPPPALYGVDGNSDPGLLRNAPPELLLGMRFTAPVSPTDDPSYRRFADAYRDALGEEPFRVEFTYDAVYLIALAMIAGGDNSREAVRDHLGAVSRPDGAGAVSVSGPAGLAAALAAPGADLDYVGASGAIDFDAAGDVTRATFAVREVMQGPGGLFFAEQERIGVPEDL